MVEQRPGMIPPRPGGAGPRRPSARQVAVRRVVGAAGVLAFLAVVAGSLWAAGVGRGHESAPPPVVSSVAPPPKPFRIRFPEGFTRREMAERVTAVDRIAKRKRGVRPLLSARQYLQATATSTLPGRFAQDRKARSLEGFLFPATYDFARRTTSAELVQDQLKAFQQRWKTVDLAYAQRKNLTPYDVLIIGSMIEKETIAPDERPLVSAVIYNRLHAHMPLGIDATLRYGLNIPATESIHESQLQSDSPYNTRKLAGLPPTPICNPGLASMQAAAHPAKVKYLFFVRKPDKVHHFFTSSYQAFQNYANAHGY